MPDGNPRDIPPAERHAILLSRLQKDVASDPTLHLVGAVDDETGEIIAVAKWYVFVGEDALRRWREGVRTGEDMEIPQAVDEEGYRYAVGEMLDARKKWFGENGREHCCEFISFSYLLSPWLIPFESQC